MAKNEGITPTLNLSAFTVLLPANHCFYISNTHRNGVQINTTPSSH